MNAKVIAFTGLAAIATVVALNACSGAPASAPTPTSQVAQPTATHSPTPSGPAETATPPPTSTSAPSSAATSTATPAGSSPTPAPPTSTPVPLPTPAQETPTPTAEAAPGVVVSEIVDFTLEDLMVARGTTVMWVNRDRAPHTTTAGTPPNRQSGVWDSGTLDQNGEFSFTFDKPGTYPYFCVIHPWMVGEVTVTESDAPPSGGPAPEPPTATPPPPPTPTPTSTATSAPAPSAVSSNIQFFVLEDLTVRVGTTVTWTNRDAAPHTSTSGTPGTQDEGRVWRSPILQQGQQFSFTFREPGTFPYFCEVHPDMIATVTVRQ